MYFKTHFFAKQEVGKNKKKCSRTPFSQKVRAKLTFSKYPVFRKFFMIKDIELCIAVIISVKILECICVSVRCVHEMARINVRVKT